MFGLSETQCVVCVYAVERCSFRYNKQAEIQESCENENIHRRLPCATAPAGLRFSSSRVFFRVADCIPRERVQYVPRASLPAVDASRHCFPRAHCFRHHVVYTRVATPQCWVSYTQGLLPLGRRASYSNDTGLATPYVSPN